jgi:hypothetical protein
MKQSKTRALLILPVAVVLLSGCPFAPKPKPPQDGQSKYFPQSSAAYCLNNLRQAYVDRGIDEYSKLFPEDFTFVFNPLDVSSTTNPTPIQWGLVDERDSADNMFSSELVERITLTFDQDPAVQSDDEFPGTWKVQAKNVRLQVDTRKEDGSQLTLLLENGKETYYFKEYSSERATDGGNLWRIWRWSDEPIGTALAVGLKASPR